MTVNDMLNVKAGDKVLYIQKDYKYMDKDYFRFLNVYEVYEGRGLKFFREASKEDQKKLLKENTLDIINEFGEKDSWWPQHFILFRNKKELEVAKTLYGVKDET